METELTDDLRRELIEAVERAALTCPESVCDWVLDAARSGGRDAGLAELARAVDADRNA